MRIGICDNNILHVRHITTQLRQMREVTFSTVVSYCEAEWLLSDLKAGSEAFDILIVNPELPPYSGADIARLSLERNASCQVIFITNDERQRPHCYAVRHAYMLPKSHLATGMLLAIQRAAALLEAARADWLEVTINAERYIVDSAQILYLERVQRQSVIKMRDASLTTYQTPQALLDQLRAGRFVRCHRSIYVNLFEVAGYKANQLTLKNGETLPIGRQYQQTVREALARFTEETLGCGKRAGQAAPEEECM